MGIPFTHARSSGSVMGWKAQGIPLLELIIPGRSRSSMRGLAARRRAENISGGFAGPKALSVRTVALRENRGKCRAVCCVAGLAAGKYR